MTAFPAKNPTPSPALWREKSATLRAAAERQLDAVARQTLLCLAEDCDAIAEEHQAQQPGKPKPPGNLPPKEEPALDPPPIREPPRPVPTPPRDPPPAPVRTRR
jgi:hypothetical protein